MQYMDQDYRAHVIHKYNITICCLASVTEQIIRYSVFTHWGHEIASIPFDCIGCLTMWPIFTHATNVLRGKTHSYEDSSN